jgi:flagellar hook assembly protein FlgD
MWDGSWKVFFASIPLESKTEAYVFPNPFSPKIDEGLKFKYTTEAVTKNVTIRIFDFGMNYVRTLIQNAPRNISSDIERVVWDGRNDAGNIVSNGVYFYRIEIGDQDPIFGKIIVMQ